MYRVVQGGAQFRVFALSRAIRDESIWLQNIWGQEPFWGFGVVFECPELFGFLKISVGEWRKAVSRMAALRGHVLGHR